MALPDIFVIALFVLTSRSTPVMSEATPVKEIDLDACQTQACQESARFLLDSMNTSVDPCHDFYQYACGGWIDKHPIPPDAVYISTLGVLTEEVQDLIIGILKTVRDEDYPKPVLDAALLFQGCIDEEAKEEQGVEPLKNVLNSFGGWPMINPEWSDVGYHWHTQVATIIRTLGLPVIVGIDVGLDISQVSRNIITLHKPKFGLGEEYLQNLTSSDETKEAVAAYRDFIISTGKLLNPNIDETELGKNADEIIQFEAALAQPDDPTRNVTDSETWYHEVLDYIERKITEEPEKEGMAVSEVERLTENEYFKWVDFLNIVFQDYPEITEETEISISGRSYLAHAIRVAHDTNPRIVSNYIGWVLVKELGKLTTKGFRDIEFRFLKVLSNIEMPEKLENTCAEEITKVMVYAVGRLYVDKYISEEAKHDVEELIDDIRSAFEVNLNHNTWMDPVTRNKALEKLRTMLNQVGYPPWIKNDTELNDYYSLVPDVKKDEFLASLVKVMEGVMAKNLEKWNKPTNRITDWYGSPTEVNAFYNPYSNAMIFPAAIFNPPVYKYGGSQVLNYAGIGSFVAHEITHGFDNTGSRRDKEGNLANWWSKETAAKFKQKAKCLQEQYSSYVEPMTNMSVNGEKTLGDNIADNGAVRNAFMAFQVRVLQSQENEVETNLKLPGLKATPEQLFFIQLGAMECTHHSELSMRYIIGNDVHAPAEYRVLVPMSNSKTFSEVFHCPIGSRMNPESKCQLW